MSEAAANSPATDRPLPLLLGKGWKQIAPRDIGKKLIWESDGQLLSAKTDFSDICTLGKVGRIDCPIAIDPVRRIAIRYACQDSGGRDFSELRSYHLDQGTQSRIFRLGLNQWILWMLKHSPKEDVVLALVATHMPGEGIRIQHQLGLYDLARSKSLLIPLPRDAFCPTDVNLTNQEVLFHGVEGWQIIDYYGRRCAHLRTRSLPLGRGGSFHPERPLVALGGGGIAVWNRDHGAIQNIHKQGQNPVWSPDGEKLWFSESSSDLFVHYLTKGTTERILAVAGNRHAEISMSRPPVLTTDGTFIALPISRKVKRDDESGPRFAFYQSLIVLDIEARELWQFPGKATNMAWYELSG
ncbi:hypothetical protein [Rubellicoccus peritrichatus]|uniref:WD40 repeat protein n=1 Tax=Rubellicoccus peritrichatus TaxID=3080537 RepID=A0AAQ3LEY6_9BACT|nr:hypothetical protein [Puniceicoccus sp. CR14]WOO43329.1 hypothetical protein RZN69_09525 [Puniceicoccus sp. CR14]